MLKASRAAQQCTQAQLGPLRVQVAVQRGFLPGLRQRPECEAVKASAAAAAAAAGAYTGPIATTAGVASSAAAAFATAAAAVIDLSLIHI